MKRLSRILRRFRRQLLRQGFRPGQDLPQIPQLEFRTAAPVAEAIARLGRTEDLRFSPNGRLLAIAGFGRRKVVLLSVRVECSGGDPVVVADDFMEIESDNIGRAHGIDFIDDETLVVANRDGLVSLLKLPQGPLAGRSLRIDALCVVRGSGAAQIDSPGSVAVTWSPGGSVELIVCNNYVDQVTRHTLESAESYREARSSVAFKDGLQVPDGVAVSKDGRWAAISSHYTDDVKLFPAHEQPGGMPKPRGALRGVNYPHGLRFTPDGAYLLVADAGSPFVHVFARGEQWGGPRRPEHSVAVLDEATFLRGRKNVEEGGPKGLDVDLSGRVVAVTCEERALTFFPLTAFTGARDAAVPAQSVEARAHVASGNPGGCK